MAGTQPAAACPHAKAGDASVSASASFAHDDAEPPPELLGDLAGLDPNDMTDVGRLVKDILLGRAPAESDERWWEEECDVPGLGTDECRRDRCCVWWYIARQMEGAFRDGNGQCGDAARAAIRLGFHDAAGWSKHAGGHGGGGGADGSIVLASEERKRLHNSGLGGIIDQMQEWYDEWSVYGVGMADLVQMGATVATVVCPL